MAEKKLNGTVIVTYRCNARCSMRNHYKAPSKAEEEISIETIKKLPKMYFTNITGGEPFIRTDLKEVVRELYKKSDRIVISTNGFFTDRIATDFGSLKYMVENDKTGLIFKYKDKDDLQSKIAYMYNHQEKAKWMGEASFELLKSKYSAQIHYGILSSLFDSLRK